LHAAEGMVKAIMLLVQLDFQEHTHMHFSDNEQSMQGAQLQQMSLANMLMSVCLSVWLPVFSLVLVCA